VAATILRKTSGNRRRKVSSHNLAGRSKQDDWQKLADSQAEPLCSFGGEPIEQTQLRATPPVGPHVDRRTGDAGRRFFPEDYRAKRCPWGLYPLLGGLRWNVVGMHRGAILDATHLSPRRCIVRLHCARQLHRPLAEGSTPENASDRVKTLRRGNCPRHSILNTARFARVNACRLLNSEL